MANTINEPSGGRCAAKVAVLGSEQVWNWVVGASVDISGRYDVILLDTFDHAYSHIKRLAPDLIVAALEMDDPQGCFILSMLKADRSTRDIPVVVCFPPAAGTADRPLDRSPLQFAR